MQKVSYSKAEDFLVNGKYTFEIGEKNKKQKQIKTVKNSFIVVGAAEFGTENSNRCNSSASSTNARSRTIFMRNEKNQNKTLLLRGF